MKSLAIVFLEIVVSRFKIVSKNFFAFSICPIFKFEKPRVK